VSITECASGASGAGVIARRRITRLGHQHQLHRPTRFAATTEIELQQAEFERGIPARRRGRERRENFFSCRIFATRDQRLRAQY
jgi:hypothetical protein